MCSGFVSYHGSGKTKKYIKTLRHDAENNTVMTAGESKHFLL